MASSEQLPDLVVHVGIGAAGVGERVQPAGETDARTPWLCLGLQETGDRRRRLDQSAVSRSSCLRPARVSL